MMQAMGTTMKVVGYLGAVFVLYLVLGPHDISDKPLSALTLGDIIANLGFCGGSLWMLSIFFD